MKLSGDSTSVVHGCPYCGWIHEGVCQRIRAIEYHPDGTIKRMEFHEAPSTIEGDYGRR